MVILGGAGSLMGPVIGAIILTIAPEIFRFAQNYRMMIIGIVMVIGVIANERGWGQTISFKFKELFNKKKTARQYLTVHRYQLPPPPPENPPPEKPDEENPPPPGVVEPVELNTAVE